MRKRTWAELTLGQHGSYYRGQIETNAVVRGHSLRVRVIYEADRDGTSLDYESVEVYSNREDWVPASPRILRAIRPTLDSRETDRLINEDQSGAVEAQRDFRSQWRDYDNAIRFHR